MNVNEVNQQVNNVNAYTAQKSHYPPANHLLSTPKNVLLPGHILIIASEGDN